MKPEPLAKVTGFASCETRLQNFGDEASSLNDRFVDAGSCPPFDELATSHNATDATTSVGIRLLSVMLIATPPAKLQLYHWSEITVLSGPFGANPVR